MENKENGCALNSHNSTEKVDHNKIKYFLYICLSVKVVWVEHKVLNRDNMAFMY